MIGMITVWSNSTLPERLWNRKLSPKIENTDLYDHRFLKLQFTRWTLERRQRLKHKETQKHRWVLSLLDQTLEKGFVRGSSNQKLKHRDSHIDYWYDQIQLYQRDFAREDFLQKLKHTEIAIFNVSSECKNFGFQRRGNLKTAAKNVFVMFQNEPALCFGICNMCL